MKVFLIGMPGSGKTTLGRELAKELKLSFIDLDEVIVQREGKPVSEIFAAEGEAYFRNVESEALNALATSALSFVMATGGGAPCFHDGIEVINKNGISIFLDVPIDELVKRLTADVTRPLLQQTEDQGLVDRLKALHKKRHQCYSKATIVLHGDRISSEDALPILLKTRM